MNLPPVKYDIIQLKGGFDQVTPTMSLPAGVARRAANFECSVTGGYTRIAGYERFDGRPSPAAASYLILYLDGSVAVGSQVSGLSSAATGTVIAVEAGRVVITRQVGTFLTGETLQAAGVTVGVIADQSTMEANAAKDAQYSALAANVYRTDIQAVPGSGPVRGVVYYQNAIYAWRNNVAGTALGMYKSSAAGWVAVTLPKELGFSAGKGILDGDTVTGAVSGATGVVARVVLESGDWTSLDGAGRLILSSSTGAFQANEDIKVGGVVVGKATGAATQITLAPGGRVETVQANFGGGVSLRRLYGVDGKNRAFEFDGTTYVPIVTGMASDKPNRVMFHRQHLFLAFGASLQFSAIGNPYQWSPLLGAGELVLNEEITNLIVLPGDQSSGAMGVYTRNDTAILYGTSSADFNLKTFNSGTGGFPYTAQNLDQSYVLDDRGVISLGTSLNFGNFVPSSLTMNVAPFIRQRKSLVSASILSREKGQYRVFFSDAYGLYLTIVNGNYMGAMPVQYDHAVLCTTEGESSAGESISFFGSDNGFVYQFDRGTSFDGNPISASINLVFNAIGSPRVIKRFRKASVEMTGNSYAVFAVGYDIGYRKAAVIQPNDRAYSNDLRSSNWDEMTWDEFVWDGQEISPSEIEMSGSAENLAIRITSVSDMTESFTVNSIIIHYTPRRGVR